MNADDENNSTPIPIEYSFKLSDSTEEVFRLELHPETLEPIGNVPDNLPRWTRLGVHQCPVCALKVTETEPTLKTATVTSSYKPAILETGLKVQVPPFISEGEIIRIDTSDGKYLERAK